MRQQPTPPDFGGWLARSIEAAVPGAIAQLIQDSGNDRQAEMVKQRSRRDDDE
jgi:hypothetical protein